RSPASSRRAGSWTILRELGTPAGAELVTHLRPGQPVAVGKVLPVAGEQPAVGVQSRLAEALDQHQDLTLGMRAFQRQPIVVQQAAEQRPIEQAQRLTRLAFPERLGAAGDILWQA